MESSSHQYAPQPQQSLSPSRSLTRANTPRAVAQHQPAGDKFSFARNYSIKPYSRELKPRAAVDIGKRHRGHYVCSTIRLGIGNPALHRSRPENLSRRDICRSCRPLYCALLAREKFVPVAMLGRASAAE